MNNSADAPSMSNSNVSDIGPIDFAVKTLIPPDGGRIHPSVPLRTLTAPPISRPGTYPHHSAAPAISGSQKTVNYNRLAVATSSTMSSGTAVTGKPTPSLSTSAPTTATPAFLLPRGGAQVTSSSGPRPSPPISRATMTIQPVSSAPSMVRGQSPMINPNHRGLRPSPPRPPNKPGSRPDHPRPVVLPNAQRPLTLTTTTQLHVPEKGMKLPVGSLAQVVPIRNPFCSVPTFIGANQTTILQRADGVTLQSAPPGAVLSSPVRLAPPLTPLMTTQRVAVSVGARLAIPQQHMSSAPTTPHRTPTQGVRGPHVNQGVLPKMSVPSMPPARIAYATHPPPSRTSTQVTVALANSKPITTVVAPGARVALANHQRPPTPQGVPTTGLLVHPQLVVSTAGRSTLVAPPGTKVIQHSLPGSIQLSTSTKSIATSSTSTAVQTSSQPPLLSKPVETYKMSSNVSLTRIGGPPSKSYPIGVNTVSQSQPPILSIPDSDQPHLATSTVYIPATSRTNPSPGVITEAAERHTYTLPGGASYFYEAPSGYHLATDAPLVARPLSPDAPHSSRQLATEGPLIARPFTPSLIGAGTQTMRYNPVMVMESGPGGVVVTPAASVASTESASTTVDSAAPCKLTASPRPSILRKRDSEGNINVKVVKNLTAALSGHSRTPSPPTSLHCETAPSSSAVTATEVGPSSNGSTTISASSSPGPEEPADPDRGPEMSPRKKPRKQLLNDANESIDMEFISNNKLKKKKEGADTPRERREGAQEAPECPKTCVLKKPTAASLLRSYKHPWKARNNHFQRYTDVRTREERRPSVTELANQKHISQRIKGWKIYHLSTQFENLSEMESGVLDRLSTVFKVMDSNLGKECEKDVDRVNELIMGNIQRSKVIRDQMSETKQQMMKGFDHKVHVSEILTRCASKRNFKKRDKH